jgi:peptidyl-prolyl cis-trans isomerase B (cyclophilin B)
MPGAPTMRKHAFLAVAACAVLAVPAFAPPPAKKEKVREEVAVIDTNLGRIAFRFFQVESPKTIHAFKSMVKAGIYDGTLFHRVLPGLMVEAGDPESREGGPAPAGAIVALDLENSDLKHRVGTVSMAHPRDDLHSRSEFFICLQEVAYFDGRYTIIGEVIAGLKVAEAISQVPRNTKQAPLYPVRIRRLILEMQEFLKEVR